MTQLHPDLRKHKFMVRLVYRRYHTRGMLAGLYTTGTYCTDVPAESLRLMQENVDAGRLDWEFALDEDGQRIVEFFPSETPAEDAKRQFESWMRDPVNHVLHASS